MKPRRILTLAQTAALTFWAGVASVGAVSITVSPTVVDGAGNPVANYRWQLEEDNTAPGTPGVPRNDTVSLVIHKSHAPVVASGDQSKAITTDSAKRYFLSVVASGYSVGGIDLTNGQSTARVILNKHPIPTAQISVLAFHDNNPINNVPDATEQGIPGCHVILHDFLGGPMLTDVFGNPLGTTYKFNAAGNPIDDLGNEIVDPSQSPAVDKLGSGAIYTDANGKALIKYLAMGKYGVQVIPPSGSDWTGGHGSQPNINGAWHQTATIEGTATIDAWVKANEPMIFMEGFGPGTYHVFFGFVDPKKLPGLPATTTPVTLTGTLRFNHFGRPPNNQQNVAGPPVVDAWVGLNELGALGAAGRGLYAAACDPATGEFRIPNVPPGAYQLVSWDQPLDALFGIHTITVASTPSGVQALGNVLSFRWFGTYEGSVFYDANQNGFREAGEEGIPQQVLNLRWRDGTVYMSTVTDAVGDFAMSEVFPFFKWLVAEVDFARFKPTGMTTVVDEGGTIPADNGWAMPSEGVRNPQPQYATNPDGTIDYTQPLVTNPSGNNLSRTELSTDPAAPLLLEGMHLFLNQNNRIDWGKVNYSPGENGGIAGIVGYGNTRAEEDPRQGTIDPWEPGVPRVQVVLYQDANSDKVIDDVNTDGQVTLADIDNYPFGFRDGAAPGPEDVDRNGDGVFEPGDAIQIVWTDSWDDLPPTGSLQPNPPVILGRPIIGSDNYATWNQVREAVFDGGYLFGSYYPGGMTTADLALGLAPVNYLKPGMYIVQACPPPSYLIQTEESFNVTMGDAYKPSKLLLPPELVGTPVNHAGDANLANIVPATRDPLNLFRVPDYLSLFPDQLVPAPFAGQVRPIADMKWVRVADGKNAACDFHVYTEVPKATRVVGFVLNDLTAEFDSKNPIFGEKGSPGWLPVSFRDWAGHEVARTYSDEYGSYEALLPSSYSAAVPMPSGFAPNMLTLVLNDATMPDPANPNNRIPDPNYNPAYATTPWTLHYYPGTFLYADTPIVPIAGFVGGPNKQLDVEPPTGTPVIKYVEGTLNPAGGSLRGAWVGSLADTIKITSLGTVNVPDPTSLGFGSGNVVSRDFGFGAAGGTVTFNGAICAVVGPWANDVLTVQLPAGLAASSAGQLMVTRSDTGKTTPIGVTVTYEPNTAKVRFVTPANATITPLATPIQAAIDAASAGDLVVVPPSPFGDYNENPILWKAVRLQGAGLGTVINANPVPAERLAVWHAKVAAILGGDPFTANEAPGVLVLGNANFATQLSGIDGFQIKGAIAGGGIGVWNGAANLRISNNRVIGNQGSLCGGIALGQQGQPGILYDNPNVTIEYNQILQNGGVNGAGGIGIYTGATGYRIRNNYIMGNFTRGSGGGIAHEGRSPGGLIANNVIAFNEVFYGVPAAGVVVSGDGGGIFIAGVTPAAGGLSDGSGSVTIINNLIQGNLVGAGHGGGIRAAGINGADVSAAPGAANSASWYALDILNNVIVNNTAGYSGGGISLQDAARVRVLNNTVANNESTATAQAAFGADPNVSTPQGAGLVTHQHSATLAGQSGQTFCDPDLRNNIFFHNRSFFYNRTLGTLVPNSTPYVDLQVAEGGGTLTPVSCLVGTDPGFAAAYVNILHTAVVVDEAGNNISVRIEPIGIFTPAGAVQGDYHLASGSSPAAGAGANVTSVSELASDFDGQARDTAAPDIGADEYSAVNPGIVPPAAPALTVAQNGPAATGAAPPLTPGVPGAGVPPGPEAAPLSLNPLPGDPLNPLNDPEPAVDSDGDGNPANDYAYYHLAAGDGFATMADGTELYTFGFSDVTGLVLAKTAEATAQTTPEAKEAVLRQIGTEVKKHGLLGANISAPTMIFKEGQHAYLDLSNVGMLMRPDLFDPHTVHFHGFPNAASIFDGEPMASISIGMGGTLRYYYKIVEPGTYLYHCHVEATEHMQMGMIGNLYVLPKQNNLPVGTPLASLPAGKGTAHVAGYKYAYDDGDGSTYYDVEAPLQITGFDRNFHEQHIAVQPLPFAALQDDYPMLNGRGYPHTIVPGELGASPSNLDRPSQRVTSLVTATKGQQVLLRISNVSETDIHTVTVMGIPMKVVAKDARLLRGPRGASLAYASTSVTLGGGETSDVILDTSNVPAGTYVLYTTRLNHLSNGPEDYGGIMTEIVINAP